MDEEVMLTKEERRLLGKEQKRREREDRERSKKLKNWIIGIAIVGLIVSGIWYLATRPGIPEEGIISRKGLHWHPELAILIKGEKQEVSANIGIGAVHKPIHTHDATGVIHMEMQGLVTKEDTKLGKFFVIWGKTFSSNCIFEFCNGEEGNVKFLVNGQENGEFENYEMHDGDKIEIRFE